MAHMVRTVVVGDMAHMVCREEEEECKDRRCTAHMVCKVVVADMAHMVCKAVEEGKGR